MERRPDEQDTRVPTSAEGNGQVVGMLTLADVALERDSRSTLADISAAPPNT